MNVRPDLRMSKAAFIEWDAAEGVHCELVRGRVVMMPRPSLNHGMIVSNLHLVLRTKLDAKQWAVIIEFGLDTGPETLRYPDAVVFRSGSPGKSYTTHTCTACRSAVAVKYRNRFWRQGRRVSGVIKSARLHRAVAGRTESLDVVSHLNVSAVRAWTESDFRHQGRRSRRRVADRTADGRYLRRG